jgi:hypothetical protein
MLVGGFMMWRRGRLLGLFEGRSWECRNAFFSFGLEVPVLGW